MRFPHLRTLVLLSAMLAVGPSAAQAPGSSAGATSSADPDAMNERARTLFREGTRLYREQKWAQAEAAFEAAFLVTENKSRGIVNNLGQAEMHLGKYREAAEHLTMARRLTPKDDKILPDIERDLAEAKKRVGTLPVKASVDGAQIVVNGRRVGEAPLVDPVFVDAGKVSVTAFKEGYDTAKVELDVSVGQEVPVLLELRKTDAAPTATATPPRPLPPPRSKVPAFVLGGAALAGVGVGAALLAASRGEYDRTKQLADAITSDGGTCKPGAAGFDGRCAEAEGAANASNALKVGGIVGFSVAGAAAAGAVIYLVWPEAKPNQGATQIVPVAAANSGGVVVTGRF